MFRLCVLLAAITLTSAAFGGDFNPHPPGKRFYIGALNDAPTVPHCFKWFTSRTGFYFLEEDKGRDGDGRIEDSHCHDHWRGYYDWKDRREADKPEPKPEVVEVKPIQQSAPVTKAPRVEPKPQPKVKAPIVVQVTTTAPQSEVVPISVQPVVEVEVETEKLITFEFVIPRGYSLLSLPYDVPKIQYARQLAKLAGVYVHTYKNGEGWAFTDGNYHFGRVLNSRVGFLAISKKEVRLTLEGKESDAEPILKKGYNLVPLSVAKGEIVEDLTETGKLVPYANRVSAKMICYAPSAAPSANRIPIATTWGAIKRRR
ncbi:MAG: hypothetical protein OXT74_05755 [Candidatus Poribacteria bacterium]|nr:hypothetical protein [Candidatus Poribacteria bacterium]